MSNLEPQDVVYHLELAMGTSLPTNFCRIQCKTIHTQAKSIESVVLVETLWLTDNVPIRAESLRPFRCTWMLSDYLVVMEDAARITSEQICCMGLPWRLRVSCSVRYIALGRSAEAVQGSSILNL
jgi:hypothetical protein